MTVFDWLLAAVLTAALLEGFTLAVFPRQFKQILHKAPPQALQAAGLLETALAAVALALWYGA